VKRGEKAALRGLPSAIRSRITPLLEIVERKPDKTPTLNAHLNNAFKDLAETAQRYARCFLDTREIAPDGVAAALDTYRRASAAGIVFAPVTGISRASDTVVAALEHRMHGIVLRLTREEFENGHLRGSIDRFLRTYRLEPEEIDLVIDLGGVSDLIADGVVALTDAFLSEIDQLVHWKTVTVSACAFPLSMRDVDRNSDARVERADWLAWRDGLHARRHNLTRLPTFSDCAIQHPKGVEGFDFRTMQVSAAARYTLDEEWLLIKGVSTRQRLPGVQFPAIARNLVEGSLRSYYRGAQHCQGCASIEAAARGADGLGSPEAWRRLGTIHHLTSVVEGLSALPWP